MTRTYSCFTGVKREETTVTDQNITTRRVRQTAKVSRFLRGKHARQRVTISLVADKQSVPGVLVVRIVDFGRGRRVVAEPAVVAAVQAGVAVVHSARGPLVDGRRRFAGRRRQRQRRRREERSGRRYVTAVLTGHDRSRYRRRRRTVPVGSDVGPGPSLKTKRSKFVDRSIRARFSRF